MRFTLRIPLAKRQYIEDPLDIRRGIRIPLPRGRALRIGFGFEAWCRLGPLRYNLLISQDVWDQLVKLAGVEGAEAIRAEMGATLAVDPYKGTPVNLE